MSFATRWIIGQDGEQGKVIFPESFNGIIATEVKIFTEKSWFVNPGKNWSNNWHQLATTETLGHYGARLAESDYNQTVELKSRFFPDVL